VGVSQQAQNKAIGQIVGETQAELERLREQVATLSGDLAFVKGLLHGSGGAKHFFSVRGAWRAGERYSRLDVVERENAWYVAKCDDPGRGPGEGWQIGPVGKRGERGEPGRAGERGARGDAGADAQTIMCWGLDRRAYCVTPILSDGTKGPTLELRGLFEAYHNEVLCALDALVGRCPKEAPKEA